MTQEEKAKAYDEALERARKLKEDPQGVFYEYSPKEGDTICDYIFPELAESEDERIRKSLAAYFAKFKQSDMWDNDFSFGDILAWLEKQVQKPTDEEMKEVLRTEYEKGRADAIAERMIEDFKNYMKGE
jgi:hypothetical protein